jgi:hypothetical protein
MLFALIGAEGRGQHDAGVVDEDVGADGMVFESRSAGDCATEGSILPSLSAMSLSSIGFSWRCFSALESAFGSLEAVGTVGASAARPANG